jgi:hypothetical protein
MTCGSEREEPSVSDGLQTEGYQACCAALPIFDEAIME